MAKRGKKPDALRTIKSLAETVGEAFNIDTPEVTERPRAMGKTARDWEFQFSADLIWTDYGKAQLAIRIHAEFLHVYFCFDDVKRAARSLNYDRLSLNIHSGKWNFWTSPPVDLTDAAQVITARFYAVNDPNPDPAEVADWKAKDEARRQQFRRALAEAH